MLKRDKWGNYHDEETSLEARRTQGYGAATWSVDVPGNWRGHPHAVCYTDREGTFYGATPTEAMGAAKDALAGRPPPGGAPLPKRLHDRLFGA